MSGGPPHHPHNRPPANTAWNHLQVPNFFPSRQPQHAHMSNEHPLLHQPTWHTPTTEPLKAPNIQHSHLFNLEQMLSEQRPFAPRHSPGVDLSITRNGNQNGEMPTAPISLSVRDTNKINSLAASALDIQGTELMKLTLTKPTSPIITTTSPTPVVQHSPKAAKKAKRVDSILERLNPQTSDDQAKMLDLTGGVVVVQQASSSHDENSNSSSLNVPTIRDEEVVSPYSNEDSLDSNKSRRKRKPCKTMRVAKEHQPIIHEDELDNEKKVPERRKSDAAANSPSPQRKKGEAAVNSPLRRKSDVGESAAVSNSTTQRAASSPHRRKSEAAASSPQRRKSDASNSPQRKSRRKTSSESETIDKIAAMVNQQQQQNVPNSNDAIANDVCKKQSPVSVAQKKEFVAVEDKLEEMFAGLEDPKTPQSSTSHEKDGCNDAIDILTSTPSTSHEKVTSTSNEVGNCPTSSAKKRRMQNKRNIKQGGDNKNKKKNLKKDFGKNKLQNSIGPGKKINGKAGKVDAIKDVYAYDSGSNASSAKSKGPFVQIRGPRDSPISVNVVNTPTQDDDNGDNKRTNSKKKFHDDSEYRLKVRSKGLHCSTLSNKYDAQTKDASWICVFCKRGSYSNEFTQETRFYTPGDLFGPYIITHNCPEFERRLDDPYDKQYCSKKAARTIDGVYKHHRKSKRKSSECSEDGGGGGGGGSSSVISGEFNVGIIGMDEGNYEIWAHEDCIVWSPGIYLVGPKIVGLEEAVWTSSNVSCAKCNVKGANICCLKRGCASVVHLGCAYIANWQLDEENYKAYCIEHRKTVQASIQFK